MGKEIKMQLNINDREKVLKEIEQLQARVIQTLVPTILAQGLLAIGIKDEVTILSLGCAFSILFASSFYVCCLSYKIFRNASFLKVFDLKNMDLGNIFWENVLSRFNKKARGPFLLHSETTTAGGIYMVLAITFFFVFYKTDLLYSIIGSVVLIFVASIIFVIYIRKDKLEKKWIEVRDEIALGN